MAKTITKSMANDLLNRAEKLKKEDRKRGHRTKIVHGAGVGDKLASGAPSATFRMPAISQDEWDRIFPPKKD